MLFSSIPLFENWDQIFSLEHIRHIIFLAALMIQNIKGRQVGHVLLDQHFFAGLGNYLRSEILFVSQLHPKRTLVV